MYRIILPFFLFVYFQAALTQIGPSWWQFLPDDYRTNPVPRDTIIIQKISDDVIENSLSLSDLWDDVSSEKFDIAHVVYGACNISDAADMSAQGMAFFDNIYFYVLFNVNDEEVNIYGNDRIEMHLAPYADKYDPGRALFLDRTRYNFKDSSDGNAYYMFGDLLGLSEAVYTDMALYGSWTEAGAYKTEWVLNSGENLYPSAIVYFLEGSNKDILGDVMMGHVDVPCKSIYEEKTGGYFFLAITPLNIWDKYPDREDFPMMSIALKVNDDDSDNGDCSEPPDDTHDRSEAWGPGDIDNNAYWAIGFYGAVGIFQFGFEVLPEIKHVCPGQSNGSVHLTASGGHPPYLYLWSTGAATASVADLTPGQYWYKVTDDLGSIITATLEIIEAGLPSVEITDSAGTSYYGFSDGMACVEASGGTAPYSFQWDDPENTMDLLVQNLKGNETYHVTVTDANGCFSVDSVKIPESDELYVDISLISGLVCQGDSNGTASAVPWYAEPPLDIVWDDPAGTTDSVVTNLYPGRYFHVNVTDAKGKTGSDSIFFSKPEPIVLNSLLITNVHTCYGFENGSVTITANMEQDPLLYSVDGGNTFQEDGYFSDLGAGEYSLVIKDTNDCILEIDSIVISQPEKVRTGMIAGYKNVTEGDITFYSVTQKSGSVFNWMVEGGNLIAGQGSNFINVQWGSGLSGTVSVVETDATECVGDTVRVEVSIKGLGIQEDKKGNDRVNVYPNPFNENTIIKFPNPKHRKYELTVTDFAGRVMMNAGEITGDEYELNRGGLPAGLYMVEIRGPEIFRQRIIIE